MPEKKFAPFPDDYVPWPWVDQNGSGETEAERYGPETIAVWTVIDRFYRMMEAGTEYLLQPDPDYPKAFTEQQLDHLVKVALDEWFAAPQNANWAVGTRKLPHDRLPEFHRLPYLQRLALAQALDAALIPAVAPEPVIDPMSGMLLD